MSKTDRTTLVQLYKAAIAANTKVKRNADKLAFMSMTRNNMFAFETYGDQLAAYEAEAHKATAAFTSAAYGLPAGQIVSIITEAQAA